MGATRTLSEVEIAGMKNDIGSLERRMPKIYWGGSERPGSVIYTGGGFTVGGQATFYLTDDGTQEGEALFSSINTDHGVHISHKDPTESLVASVVSLSEDKKTLVIGVQKIANVILGIIQRITDADGLAVSITVYGEPA